MHNEEYNLLFRRADDLYKRSQNSVMSTGFLSPAEQVALERYASGMKYENMHLYGGADGCERKAAFFLPEYMDAETFDADGFISAFSVTARFSSLGHRDYLGALLGLGIKREFVGDIYVFEERAFFFAKETVSGFIEENFDKVGRYGVKTEKIARENVPMPERSYEKREYTVKSLRLDAVTAGLFGVSRTESVRLIEQGLVSLNYSIELRPDENVKKGDIISARGYGKGQVESCENVSRKGRIFVNSMLYK